MHRGYLKFWRRAEDSRVWSRGIEYRGLLITLLARANHKESYFLGQRIQPGQIATSMQTLADDLGISRQKLQRMFSNLEKDGVVKVENAGNRFSMITVLNYCEYQESDKSVRATDNITADITTGQQPGTSKECKNIYSSSLRSEELSPEVSDDASTAVVKKLKDTPPDCPHQRVIALYREVLPSLPEVRVWNDERQKQLRSRWRESWERLKKAGAPRGEEDVLTWWHKFFERVKASPWLMGQVENKNGTPPFLADLVWLTKPRNFANVIDGKYLNRSAA